MGLKEWLIPQDKAFFDLLEKQCSTVIDGTTRLIDILNNLSDLETNVKALKNVEHEGDKLLKNVYVRLGEAFVTPLDKEDIALLASQLDDILDMVYASANRVFLYGIDKTDRSMVELAEIILKSSNELATAIKLLGNMKNGDTIERHVEEVHKLENLADDILNDSLSKTFKNKDIADAIKRKEIIEYLELATDKCEDAANVIGDILLKHR